MPQVKKASKRRLKSKALPVLGAAGLSLSLASGASAATAGATTDMLARNSAVSHEIALRDEEVFDVSLATFYVVQRENTVTSGPGLRLVMGACGACGGCAGCGGCGTGTNYGTSTLGNDVNPPYYYPPRAAHAYRHAAKRKHDQRNNKTDD